MIRLQTSRGRRRRCGAHGNVSCLLWQISRHVLQPVPLLVTRFENDEINRMHMTGDIEHEILGQRIADDDLLGGMNPRAIVCFQPALSP